MTNEEWEKEYPAHKAKSLPPVDSRWDRREKPFTNYTEAHTYKDGVEEDQDAYGIPVSLIVVVWEGLYYVCYDEGYVGGFSDYEKSWPELTG